MHVENNYPKCVLIVAALNMKERVKLINVTPLDGLFDHSLITMLLTLPKCIPSEVEEPNYILPQLNMCGTVKKPSLTPLKQLRWNKN